MGTTIAFFHPQSMSNRWGPVEASGNTLSAPPPQVDTGNFKEWGGIPDYLLGRCTLAEEAPWSPAPSIGPSCPPSEGLSFCTF